MAGGSFIATEGTTGVEQCELDSDSLDDDVFTGSGLMGEKGKGEDEVLDGTGDVVQLGPVKKKKKTNACRVTTCLSFN